ncbi:cysteine-rich protein 2-binding protein [Diabrotica virgifera virgifera]|uniref:Cysteine-rich protein 2-binding protein n=1 Tax=Diabrotica virgifera virgifera TaxID=50390 RepID=A0ABM5K798_DIAVI|nr:cysteine-rich protein 2-binding protein [Diabrotica virgifera virgifera]
MDLLSEVTFCKYCTEQLKLSEDEGLECTVCKKNVHLRCLKRGAVPGGLSGDTFFTFICLECSVNQAENFTRTKLSWLQVIVLVLYHLQHKSPGLARKGFFHWRHHVATFVDRNWEILFPSDQKRKKKWMGTIAGTLSHFNRYIFLSGITVFNEPAFWALMYPKISPLTVSIVYSAMILEKQNMKNRKEILAPDAELFYSFLSKFVDDPELIKNFNSITVHNNITVGCTQQVMDNKPSQAMDVDVEDNQKEVKPKFNYKRKKAKFLGFNTRKLTKLTQTSVNSLFPDDIMNVNLDSSDNTITSSPEPKQEETKAKETLKLLDPFCHYNTSLNSIARARSLTLQAKLTGGIRQELILSPYSGIYLKPYIRRDVETFPTWLKLMAEIQVTANKSNKDYRLPPRGPIDYAYVQPEHIPAINSLCNQFFWPGIDLTETLQYPDFSCVVLYKRLIIGFSFLVPDVKNTENYMSFLFTRPGWRNCGIAKFMIYHLIQTSLEKDITLHVSMNNPALLLYQRFGFKVENVVLGFYDKFLRSEVNDSKHAFLCRLERR